MWDAAGIRLDPLPSLVGLLQLLLDYSGATFSGELDIRLHVYQRR
jgi:hypothetical protein